MNALLEVVGIFHTFLANWRSAFLMMFIRTVV